MSKNGLKASAKNSSKGSKLSRTGKKEVVKSMAGGSLENAKNNSKGSKKG